MKKLEQLRARLSEIHTKAEAISNLDEVSDEESAEFDALMAEADTVKADIKRLEKLEDLNQDVNASAGRRAQPAAPRFEVGDDRRELDPWRGFEGAADFAQAVLQANPKGVGSIDARLTAMNELLRAAPTNFHRETGADEGYMVPPAMRDAIWEVVNDTDDILAHVDDEPTNANSVQMVADESTPWGSSGIQANWSSEGSQFSASKLSTKSRTVTLHKLYAFALSTDELLQDGPRMNDRLTRKAGLAIRWKVSDAIFNGSGAGQPLGFFNADCLVSVAKETSQTADTVNADNVAKMFARNINPGAGRWYVNNDVLPQLLTMTLGDQPIYMPPQSGFRDAPGGFLLGRPVIITQHCNTVGDLGDIYFVDGMGYYAPRKEGTQFASSIHLYFDYDIEAFRWTFRFGGQPYLSDAVTPANGSNSLSHFVALAARA